MGSDNLIKRTNACPREQINVREANERVAILTLAQRQFTPEEYERLCADMGKGAVEFRLHDDGIVLMRKF